MVPVRLPCHPALRWRTLLYTAVTRTRRLVVRNRQRRARTLAVKDGRLTKWHTALACLLDAELRMVAGRDHDEGGVHAASGSRG